MKKKLFIFLLLFPSFLIQKIYAQYPPQFPLEGNESINYLDTRIIAWADRCTVTRGFMDISDPSLGLVEAGDDTNAIGIADGMTVSLGDSGIAVLEFDVPIVNGEGPDFVIFENGFPNPLDNQVAFLELAFVEVSTNGIEYYRFPSVSLLQTDTQFTNDSYLDARNIHNLAGKYIRNQGTPFDLEELKDEVGLDVNNIRYIRIIDVIGMINNENFRSFDSKGTIINDPYPTPFPTGGFDLDAVGVINNIHSTSVENLFTKEEFKIYPNPASEYIHIEIPVEIHRDDIEIFSLSGQKFSLDFLDNSAYSKKFQLNATHLPNGIYFIKFKNIVKSFVKR